MDATRAQVEVAYATLQRMAVSTNLANFSDRLLRGGFYKTHQFVFAQPPHCSRP